MLTADQRALLLRTARASIEAVLSGRAPELDPSEYDAELRRPSGVFVTLHGEEGALRGCIGSIAPVAPLYEAVSSSAISAAFRDPRFAPLRRDELAAIQLEISVMSPIVPVEDLSEIVVGRDGLIVRKGHAAGLLLPQVASEYGWSRDEFLAHTCMKAGLPGDAWRTPGCRIERFSAEVFGEPNN